MISKKHVEGKNKGNLFLYALSTCGWCKKTKKLLDDLGVSYDFVFVDELEGNEKQNVYASLMNWNPAVSFPTLVVNDEDCIIGFDEDKIRGVLGK